MLEAPVDRSILGAADVPDGRLAAFVATQLGVDRARILTSHADKVAYDAETITTAGRWWVHGTADAGGRERDFRFFVKVVHSWDRSAVFAAAKEQIPPDLLEWAIASVPWATEPLVYRTDLAQRLPEGLRMPAAYAVDDLDEGSGAVWLELVIVDEGATWDLDRFTEAATLLGRLAGSAPVAALGDIGRRDFHVTTYAEGRMRYQVVPLLRDDGVWGHPLVAGPFGGLRERMLAAADRVDALAAEADALPRLVAHGDACPNNLLVVPGQPGFTLIDFAFWGPMPVGFDLSQLLVGDVQIGRRRADDLAELGDAVVPAYVRGLRSEGCDLTESAARRGLAITLLLFAGLSALPIEHLGEAPTPELLDLAGQRAAVARYALDLLEATDP